MSTIVSQPRVVTETLIVSDLHLGSHSARVREFLELLHTSEFKRLILLGDIVHGLDFHGMDREHWNVLGRIRQLTSGTQKKEVIWVAGNHDAKLKPFFTKILGVEILDDFNEFVWTAGGKKFLAVHGHKFDYLYAASKWFQRFSEFFIWLDSKVRIPRFIRRMSQLTHTTGIMEKGASLRAKFVHADTVFCGHTHKPKKMTIGDISYVNTGSWTHDVCTFSTVSADGRAELHEFVSISEVEIDWNALVGSEISIASLSESK